MKNIPCLWLMLILSAPVLAQEEAPPAETPADAQSEPAAEAVGTVPVNPGEEPAEPAAPGTPWQVFAGVDQVNTTLSVSGLSPAATSNFGSGMYRVRAGARVLERIGVEFQYGFKKNADPGDVTTDKYYGLFIAPTASVFDTVDLVFPIGYTRSTLSSSGPGESFSGVGFGVDAELPLKVFSQGMPDLRLTLGWMTYYQASDARIYGANFGLRYDFSVGGGSSEPSPPSASDSGEGFFSGVGKFFSNLWPFGGDDAKPAEDAPAQ